MNGLEWLPDVTRGLLMGGVLILALGVHLEAKEMRKAMEYLRRDVFRLTGRLDGLDRRLFEMDSRIKEESSD